MTEEFKLWKQENQLILKELYQDYLNTADPDDPDFMDFNDFCIDYRESVWE